MSKKTNPRRIPASMADVNRAKAEAQRMAIDFQSACVLIVLKDKMGFNPYQLRKFWKAYTDYADSIAKGYCSVPDLERVLEDECGIMLKRN